ncbi:MAG: type II toxin-antitoxin system Phd/YefM family antitoxin [Pseudomonadota bacterium]
MEHTLSKSKFKPHALEYFRQVQETGDTLIITDHNQPVIKIVPYTDKPGDALKALRHSVLKYENPLNPVGVDDWEALK